MLRGFVPDPLLEIMHRNSLRFAGSAEDGTLCVLTLLPEMLPDDVPISCMAIPILSRPGGMLLAVPAGYISPHVLLDAAFADETTLLGPSQEFKCFMIEEDEHGGEHRLDEAGSFLAIDVSDAILAHLREYDPVTDPSETIQTFVPEHPEAIVDLKQAFEDVRAWLETLGDSARVNFFSAREEPPEPLPKTGKRASPKRITTAALAESVASLTTQMQTLAAQQEALLKLSKASATHVPVQPNGGMTTASRVPDVSAGLSSPIPAGPMNLANLIGPPPRTKQPALAKATGPALPDTGEPLEQLQVEDQNVVTKALMQQSAAITSLVAHIAAGGDPVIDLQGSQSSALTLSTRGAAKREKMQQDLANGTSQYFLQAQQQLYKKMNPSKPLPRSDSDLLSAGASMTAYMEKFGGFKSRQDLGFIMWMLSHAMDAGAQGNSHLMREYVALTVACIDQSNLDGHWSMAYTLSLLEEPPNQVFCEKGTGMTAIGRPFSPLVPAPWASTALSFVKELEVLNTKKQETKSPKASPKGGDPPNPKSPPRRPKFPRRPKAAPEAQPTAPQ